LDGLGRGAIVWKVEHWGQRMDFLRLLLRKRGKEERRKEEIWDCESGPQGH